jgi:hypothetical protein
MPELPDRVQIDVDGQTLSLPWPSREWLLGELKLGPPEIYAEFEKTEPSQPVPLTTEQKRKLLEVIEHAAQQTTEVDDETEERVTGDDALRQYEGVPELLAALRRELGEE